MELCAAQKQSASLICISTHILGTRPFRPVYGTGVGSLGKQNISFEMNITSLMAKRGGQEQEAMTAACCNSHFPKSVNAQSGVEVPSTNINNALSSSCDRKLTCLLTWSARSPLVLGRSEAWDLKVLSEVRCQLTWHSQTYLNTNQMSAVPAACQSPVTIGTITASGLH